MNKDHGWGENLKCLDLGIVFNGWKYKNPINLISDFQLYLLSNLI
jgi:hypothetical protein